MIESALAYISNDPITASQVEALRELLREDPTPETLNGFLIVASRFVDEFGRHRTFELRNIFRTGTAEGRLALRRSLDAVTEAVGTLDEYAERYPVTIIPPVPAFPLFPIVGISQVVPAVYRTLHSEAALHATGERVADYIVRTGLLPAMPLPEAPVLRAKLRAHWCAYETWETPEQTREALQISSTWKSDCRLRVSILTRDIEGSGFVAYNGDRPTDENPLQFQGYFFEPLTQDHPPEEGGAVQIAVVGGPAVDRLELWSEEGCEWKEIWRRSDRQ